MTRQQIDKKFIDIDDMSIDVARDMSNEIKKYLKENNISEITNIMKLYLYITAIQYKVNRVFLNDGEVYLDCVDNNNKNNQYDYALEYLDVDSLYDVFKYLVKNKIIK